MTETQRPAMLAFRLGHDDAYRPMHDADAVARPPTNGMPAAEQKLRRAKEIDARVRCFADVAPSGDAHGG